MRKSKKLFSKFALLDVKRGRVGLYKLLKKQKTVPVVITGEIIGPWGYDDGESQEFEIRVKSVEVL